MAAESFDLELRLLSGGVVSGAKQSADALKALEQQMDKTSSAFEDALGGKVKAPFDEGKKSVKGFSDEVKKAIDQASKLSADPKGFQLLQRAKKDLADQRKKLLDEAGMGKAPKTAKGKTGKDDKGFGSGFFSWAQPYGGGRVGSELAGHLGASAIIGAAHILVAGATKVVDVITDGFKKAFSEGGKYESLKLGYKLSLRGAEGADSMNDTGRFSKQTGFDDDVINQWLLPLRRAGFDRKGARSAYAAASDIAAGEGRGGDQGFVQSMLESFKNIKLKGGVQERRLPEMGVDVRKFYADLAGTLKVTTDAAKKLAEEGKVNPQLLLNTIYKGVEERQGGKLGTGGIAYGKTMQARLGKIEDLPNQYLKAVAESPKWDAVSEKFGSLLEELDPDSPRGKQIVDSIEHAFETFADLADRVFTAENIDAFVAGLVKAVDVAGELVKLLGPLIDAGVTAAKYIDLGGGDMQKGIANTLINVGKGVFTGNHTAESAGNDSPYYANGKIAPYDMRPYATGSPSIAAATRGAINAPVQITIAMNGAVDASSARQVGQAIGEEAGREAARHIGRVAQEAGAR